MFVCRNETCFIKAYFFLKNKKYGLSNASVNFYSLWFVDSVWVISVKINWQEDEA